MVRSPERKALQSGGAVGLSTRLAHLHHPIRRHIIQHLHYPRWLANLDTGGHRVRPQAEVNRTRA
jgi:hypothetical protein